jgi:hypothetical protein
MVQILMKWLSNRRVKRVLSQPTPWERDLIQNMGMKYRHDYGLLEGDERAAVDLLMYQLASEVVTWFRNETNDHHLSVGGAILRIKASNILEDHINLK